MAKFLFCSFWWGIREFKFKDALKWLWGLMIVWAVALIAIFLQFLSPFTAFSLPTLTVLCLAGVIFNRKVMKYQKGLDFSGLKNINGKKAKVVKVIELDNHRTQILVQAIGVGVDEFSNKKSKLESAFLHSVESIEHSKDRKLVKIKICKRQLPITIKYSDMENPTPLPYCLTIGESLDGGVLSCNIRNLPHLLIGGATGGGKSNFFKTAILDLLKSSPHIQMYLIDLKRGVEVKEFSDLPNVRVAKNEVEAVKVLSVLKQEMERRYEYLEQKGYKFIEPKRDKMDLIVLGTDEASVLFGMVKSKRKKELMFTARDLTDELAKLARASGIHLIFATQKPIKESIDTKTLENLTARMSFKMSTHAGSNSMLGNAKAYALPDIKGRGIWKAGNKFIEVQTPFISDEELDQEILEIKSKLDGKEWKTFKPILEWSEASNEDAHILTKQHENS